MMTNVVLVVVVILFTIFGISSIPIGFKFIILSKPLVVIVLISLLVNSLVALLITAKDTAGGGGRFGRVHTRISTGDGRVRATMSTTGTKCRRRLDSLQVRLSRGSDGVGSLRRRLVGGLAINGPSRPDGV